MKILTARLLFLAVALLCLTGCDETLSDEDLALINEVSTQKDTPAVEVRNVSFSPDNKTFSVVTQTLRDIGPYSLTDSSKVSIVVKESANGVPQRSMLPVLTSVRNTEAENIAAANIKMQVVVDLTLPKKSIDSQQRAVAEMLTSFSADNLFLSFMYGDTVTNPVKATDYVMNNYFQQKPDGRKRLYRSILQKKEEMESREAPWTDTSHSLLVVFSDEEVYLDDDQPMDADHYDLQEALLQPSQDDGRVIVYYVSLNTNKDLDDEHAAGILKVFCQQQKGLYLPAFSWVDIKNSFLRQFSLDINDYEFNFENPDFKVYRGSLYTLTLDFYDKGKDSLIASTSTHISKGSIYEPVIVRGHSIWYVILQGVVLGLVLMLVAYLLFQYLIPFIDYRLFLRKHVTRYKGPLMSAGNKMVSQSCYLCKAPFEIDDQVVVKCEHVMHKSCWDENDYHCPEYGHQCQTGSHYYNRHQLHDPRNASFYMRWIVASMLAALAAWTAFLLLAHYVPTHFLDGLLRNAPLFSDIVAGQSGGVNEFAEHEKHLPLFGLVMGFFLTFGFSALALYRHSVKMKWPSILLRSLMAGVAAAFCFTVIGFIESVFDIVSYDFLIDGITWTLLALLIAYLSTARTPIRLKKRFLLPAVALAFLSMYLWSFLILGSRLDFRVLLLFSYLLFAVGLAVFVARPTPSSFHYFLRVEGPVKTMEIALYKWFDASPRQHVTIGKSVNSNLQLSWDITSHIAPVQAEIRNDGKAFWLYAVEEGVWTSKTSLEAGASVRLYHGTQFQIGQTVFTYLEKDL